MTQKSPFEINWPLVHALTTHERESKNESVQYLFSNKNCNGISEIKNKIIHSFLLSIRLLDDWIYNFRLSARKTGHNFVCFAAISRKNGKACAREQKRKRKYDRWGLLCRAIFLVKSRCHKFWQVTTSRNSSTVQGPTIDRSNGKKLCSRVSLGTLSTPQQGCRKWGSGEHTISWQIS